MLKCNKHSIWVPKFFILGYYPNTFIDERGDFMRTRNKRISLRLNEKEAVDLKEKAEKIGISTEAYLRMLIAGYVPKEKPSADFYGMMKELNAIGNSMNQIAKVANSKSFVNVMAYVDNVKKLNNIILQISKEVIGSEGADEKWLLQEYGL